MGNFVTEILSPEWLRKVWFQLLAVIAAAVLFRLFRRPFLALARTFLKKTPDTFEAVIGRRIDQAYPSWRLKAGISRRRTTLEWRIQKVRESWRRGFFILGGVYLDLMIQNIKVKKLENQEHSDLDQVRYQAGGSACHFGYYLHDNFGEQSHLYSRLGRRTVLSRELRRLLRVESWIGSTHFQRDTYQQSGVSVHLVQEDQSYRTTFTHKGALDGLDWEPVLRKLVKKTGRGGVLHISGYFRTGLHKELCRSLEQLSPNLIVCVDHGRFIPEDHINQAKTLITAFQRDLVDVYVSTFPELCQLMTIAKVPSPTKGHMVDALHAFAAGDKLPRITIVRGDVSDDEATAYVILDGTLLPPVTVRPGMAPEQDQPGRNNAFNAALAYYLTQGQPDEPLTDVVRNSVEHALRSWIGTRRRSYT